MAREYSPKDIPKVRMKLSKEKRELVGRKVTIWHAKCLEDEQVVTGDTAAEAARHFASHMARKHPGHQIKKV